jgi:hypothetical protein
MGRRTHGFEIAGISDTWCWGIPPSPKLPLLPCDDSIVSCTFVPFVFGSFVPFGIILSMGARWVRNPAQSKHSLLWLLRFLAQAFPSSIGSHETHCGLRKTVPVIEYDKTLAHILIWLHRVQCSAELTFPWHRTSAHLWWGKPLDTRNLSLQSVGARFPYHGNSFVSSKLSSNSPLLHAPFLRHL